MKMDRTKILVRKISQILDRSNMQSTFKKFDAWKTLRKGLHIENVKKLRKT